MPETVEPRARRGWILGLVLAATVGAAFAPSLAGTFIWDDVQLVEHNRHIRELRHLGRNLAHGFWDMGLAGDARPTKADTHGYYRPTVTLSLMLDYQLHGLAAWGYHLTNLLLHLAVVLVFHALGRRLLADRGTVALVVALLFAVHPSRAEAVAWIAGRSELIMGLLFGLALLAAMRGLAADPPRVRLGWLLVAGLCALGALASKESAVALAPIVPAVDWICVSRGDRARFWRNARWCHLPLLAATVVFVAVRVALSPAIAATAGASGPREWLTVMLASVGHYARLVVDPYAPNPMVAAYYKVPELGGWAALGAAVVASLAAALAVAWRRAPRAALALVLFGALLAPASNLIPLRLPFLVAERFLYLPLFGLCLLVGVGLKAASPGLRRVALAATLALAATWGVTSFVRAADYASPSRFWAAAAAADPQNPLAWQQLGEADLAQRRHARAERSLLRAVRAWPRVGDPRALLGAKLRLLEVRLLRTSDADAQTLVVAERFLADLARLARASPGPEARAALRLGSLHLVVRDADDADAAALREQLPQILAALGAVRSRLGRDAQAIAALEEALAAGRADPAVLLNLALAQARALRIDDARRAWRRAQQLVPGSPPVGELGVALRRAEDRVAALRRRGVTTATGGSADAEAQRLLAEHFAGLGAPARVARHLRRLLELRPEDLAARGALAQALAALGDLDGALAVIAEGRRHHGAAVPFESLAARVRALYAAEVERRQR